MSMVPSAEPASPGPLSVGVALTGYRGSMPPPCFPPTVCDKVPSFPLTGSLGKVRPLHWYYEDTPTSAARLAGSLRSPSDTRVAPCPSLPPAQDALPGGLGPCGSATPVPMLGYAGDGRPPRFLGNPRDGSPGSWTPVGPARQAIAACRRGPRLCQQRGLPTRKLSRLDVQAFRLTVYASSGGSPHHDARLASGCWPALPDGIRTRRVPTKGFRVVVVTSHPPLPGLAWRNDSFFPFLRLLISIRRRQSRRR
jgi:hypothetical protein